VRDIVVSLPPLLFDHLALNVELFLRERRQEEAHAVGLQPQTERQVVRWQCLKVICTIEERRSVQHAADRLDVPEMLVVAHMQRAGEQHVLEQMGEAGAPGPLVFGSHVVPEIDRHQGRGVVLVEDDAKAVVEEITFNGEHGTGVVPQTYKSEVRSSNFASHHDSSFILRIAWPSFPGSILRWKVPSASERRRCRRFWPSGFGERRFWRTLTIPFSTTSTRTSAAPRSGRSSSSSCRDTTSSGRS